MPRQLTKAAFGSCEIPLHSCLITLKMPLGRNPTSTSFGEVQNPGNKTSDPNANHDLAGYQDTFVLHWKRCDEA